MNSISYPRSEHLSITFNSCHPERSLATRGANQTESKDPYDSDTARGAERNFRIVIRFFDEREAELRPVPSREAAAWGSQARQCRVSKGTGTSPVRTAPSHESVRISK